MNSVFSSLSIFIDQPWMIPVLVIGSLVGCLVLLMGRRWLVPRPVTNMEQDEASNSLLTANLQKSPPERRSCPRRKGGNRVEVYLTDDKKSQQLFGWVVDRSMGGLCLNVEKPLSEGTVLNVRPRKAPQTAPWIAVEIRSCRPEGNEFEVGCRFLKQPQWNDLLLFG